MVEKINVAELLRDCPSGMELDCTMYEDVYFDYVDELNIINCYIKNEGFRTSITFNQHGTPNSDIKSKCVIFPKSKTTWEGFIPPRKFKDGDVIFTHTNASKGLLENSWVSIFKEYRYNRCACYVCVCLSDLDLYHDKWEDELLCELCEIEENRLATEEEKQKLFDAIKANGYKWNSETKTLAKLPRFKVGDEIVKKNSISNSYIVSSVSCNYYGLILPNNTCVGVLNVSEQDEWELVSNKFDITTLKPFDKVLVRLDNANQWYATLFSHIDEKQESFCRRYVTVSGKSYTQIIPYEGNEHLRGTKDNCEDYYKTW